MAVATVTALTSSKASVASLETFTISGTGTDWTGCVWQLRPGETTDQFATDASGDISGRFFGTKSYYNGYGTGSGLPGSYRLNLYTEACASVTESTVPALSKEVPVTPVHGAGTLNVTLYETYDSATLQATPYTVQTFPGSFDDTGRFGSKWSLVDPVIAADYCGVATTGLPAGITVDETVPSVSGEAPALKFVGTPAAGSKGTFTACLDLYDASIVCADSYWLVTLEVSDGVPPVLPDTGIDKSQATSAGIAAAALVALGSVFLIVYRRRIATVVKRH
jgi:LPXTG-motif cell wall-anchored protein